MSVDGTIPIHPSSPGDSWEEGHGNSMNMLAAFVNLLWWLILIRVILSWIVRDPSNPIVNLVGSLTDPLLRPLSRVLTFNGMDFSPMLVLIVLGAVRRALLFG